jgi:hypothetical protein
MIEDEGGLLQATIFERVYARYEHILHREGAFLLEGVVEQDIRRGFSFLVRRIESLREVLAGTGALAPKARSSSGAFLRAGRRSRRAG